MTPEDAVRFFSIHRAFRGIGFGAARIRALVQRFGNDVFTVLDSGDVAAVGEVVGKECAARIMVAHAEAKAELEVVAWLSRHGIDPGLAIKTCGLLGSEARRLITEDPYILVTLVGWRKTDELGQKLGVPSDDLRRSLGATKAVFLQGLAAGHTLFPREQITAQVTALVGAGSPGLSAAIDYGVAVVEGEAVRPAASAYMEEALSIRLRKLAKTEYQLSDLTLGTLPLNLTAEQRDGVVTVLSRGASLLCGGAGTGKTTTLLGLITAAEAEGWKCVLVAPTGKAAARMREATLRPAKTIAALLHALEKDPLPKKVKLVVDEASMVALPEAFKLIEALPECGSVVCVGDAGQLPPVGFGVVFHVLAAADSFPQAVLSRILRAAEESGIPRISQAIRTGSQPDWEGYAGAKNGVSLLTTSDAIASVIEVYHDLGGAQVLAPTRAAVGEINAELQRRHQGDLVPEFESFGLRVGDPICCTKNDYHLGVWNGSLGHVVGAERREFGLGLRVFVDGEEKILPPRYLPNVELAYAITGHRSQGSSFPRVIVLVDRSSVVDRAWIYTCVTRAEAQVVLIGHAGDLAGAITRGNSVNRRRVGFRI